MSIDMGSIQEVCEAARCAVVEVAPDLAPLTNSGYEGWKRAADEVARRRVELVNQQGHCVGASHFDRAYAAANAAGNLIGETLGTPVQKAWSGKDNLAQAREVLGLC